VRKGQISPPKKTSANNCYAARYPFYAHGKDKKKTKRAKISADRKRAFADGGEEMRGDNGLSLGLRQGR